MFFHSASFCASSVMNLSASLPVPPYGVNTRGLKEPCSISITRWLYVRFFSFSLLLKAVSSFWFRWLFANGLNTLTSKNAFCPFCQKPWALKSNQASSDELALLLSTSPVSVSRCGSTSTSWHTSLRRVANRSRTSSCLLWTNPPFMHYIAWSTSKRLPHGHIDGRYFGVHLYLRLSTS